MNADDPDSRRVQWTQPARDDLRLLIERRGFTRADFQRLAAGLRLVASMPDVEQHPWVCRLRFAEQQGETEFRFKHASLTVSVRVMFEVNADTLTVWACFERCNSTYRQAERRFCEWLRGVLAF